MPRHEGIVTCVRDDGSALVLIRPEDSGIPGAPDVNVCHCTSKSSAVALEAVNTAGASCGDRVLVYRKASALLKNAAALVAMPLAAGALCALAGMLLCQGAVIAEVAAAAGLALGLVAGIAVYRRISPRDHAEITRILRKGAAGTSRGEAPGHIPSGGRSSRADCEGCGLTPSSPCRYIIYASPTRRGRSFRFPEGIS